MKPVKVINGTIDAHLSV